MLLQMGAYTRSVGSQQRNRLHQQREAWRRLAGGGRFSRCGGSLKEESDE